jgi:hypothetical protein
VHANEAVLPGLAADVSGVSDAIRQPQIAASAIEGVPVDVVHDGPCGSIEDFAMEEDGSDLATGTGDNDSAARINPTAPVPHHGHGAPVQVSEAGEVLMID